jgi:hypothetical protein
MSAAQRLRWGRCRISSSRTHRVWHCPAGLSSFPGRTPGKAGRVDIGDAIDPTDTLELAVAHVEALKGRQQLIEGGEGRNRVRQVDAQRADALGITVGEMAERVERAPRYGVPKLISARVSFQPPITSKK